MGRLGQSGEVKTCQCGRPVQGGIGRRCGICQASFRTAHPRRRIARVAAPDPRRCPAHLEWIRSLACAVPGCRGKSEAAHVRQNSGAGTGLKPADKWAVPLCGPNGHHQEQHRLGHVAFDAKYGVNLRSLAQTLAGKSPYLSGGG